MKENTVPPQYKRHIFVCTSCKNDNFCENDDYAKELRSELKVKCKELFSKDLLRVNASGCLGVCNEGIHIVIYPEAKWFKLASKESISDIINYLNSNS